MLKNDILKCTYISWWWTTYYHGDYKIISIWKTIRLELIKEWNFKTWLDDKLTINKEASTGRRLHKNLIDSYTDNGFIVYCEKAWIPFIFTNRNK